MGSDASFRDSVLDRLREDLLGPLRPEERLRAPRARSKLPREGNPTDRYLTGILWPLRSEQLDFDQEEMGTGSGNAAGGEQQDEGQPPTSGAQRPSMCGLSFAIKGTENEAPSISIVVRGAFYQPGWVLYDENEEPVEHLGEFPPEGAAGAEGAPAPRDTLFWERVPFEKVLPSVQLRDGSMDIIELGDSPEAIDRDGLSLYIHAGTEVRLAGGERVRPVTVRLMNTHQQEDDSLENERNSFMQAEVIVSPVAGSSELVPRPRSRAHDDEDLRLLYRKSVDYAVGHNCSARWALRSGRVKEVGTSWMPDHTVGAVSADPLEAHAFLNEKTLSASWLSSAPAEELLEALRALPAAYREWLADQERREVAGIDDEELAHLAARQLAGCGEVARRIEESIDFLGAEPRALSAFQLANEAMVLQAGWAGYGEELTWRPFQLGYQLLALFSLADPWHPDRAIMDLLWFPTGGGKTEAYLGLVAFLCFYRRLRSANDPDRGSGTAVIMRYTLRLLTLDQFRRASRLICACDLLRSRDLARLGGTPISIGLWIGGDSTPNKVKEAAKLLSDHGARNSPRQIEDCPCCGGALAWRHDGAVPKIFCECTSQDCDLARVPGCLPIHTVDEDLYRESPSLVISTIDKFAQVAFAPRNVANFLGGGGAHDPPDLVLQDELHLISGPLGSLAGGYELAIEEACRRPNPNGEGDLSRIKIIGSTATIRRAQDQVSALYNRETQQFPPSALDWDKSYFMMPDESEGRPTRRYVALSSIGRSPKYALQFAYASLLLSGKMVQCENDEDRDSWWTLLGYFNALRELGGSLVMLSDDVIDTMNSLAVARHEAVEREKDPGVFVSPRQVGEIQQLTSRVPQVELKEIFNQLNDSKYPAQGALDAVLATNMVSVGVDVDRLGLMCVFAQPKQIAEYIQATSRIGRRDPGLVLTVYKNSFARDRAFYESFGSWMSALYRDVEPTSVTPFASRARDRVLGALLVCLSCLPLRGQGAIVDSGNPLIDEQQRGKIKRVVFPLVRNRISSIETEETARQAESELERKLDIWFEKSEEWRRVGSRATMRVSGGGNAQARFKKALLISNEQAQSRDLGALGLDLWLTAPNSMRNVDPGCPVKFAPAVRAHEEEATQDA